MSLPNFELAVCPSCGHSMDVHAAHPRLKGRLACFECTEGSCDAWKVTVDR